MSSDPELAKGFVLLRKRLGYSKVALIKTMLQLLQQQDITFDSNKAPAKTKALIKTLIGKKKSLAAFKRTRKLFNYAKVRAGKRFKKFSKLIKMLRRANTFKRRGNKEEYLRVDNLLH